jgi:hypothetical protein
VGVSLFEEGDWWQWCRFNTSVLAQEEIRREEALSKDELDATNSS